MQRYVSATIAEGHSSRFVWLSLIQAAGTSCVAHRIYRAFLTNFNFRTLAYLYTKSPSCDDFVNQSRKTTKFHSIFLKTFLKKIQKLSEISLCKFERFIKSYNNKYTQNAWWRFIRVDVLLSERRIFPMQR